MSRTTLSYANVVSTLCLLLLITGSGVAYAGGKIGSGDLKKDAVKSRHIKNGKIKSKDVKDGTIKSRDVGDGALTGADIADGSITGADVANGSLGSLDIRNGSLRNSDFGENTALPLAGVNVHGTTGIVRNSFSRTGGQPIVERNGIGSYDIVIPGIDEPETSGLIYSIAPFGDDVDCYIDLTFPASGTILVECRDNDSFTDTSFSLTIFDA